MAPREAERDRERIDGLADMRGERGEEHNRRPSGFAAANRQEQHVGHVVFVSDADCEQGHASDGHYGERLA